MTKLQGLVTDQIVARLGWHYPVNRGESWEKSEIFGNKCCRGLFSLQQQMAESRNNYLSSLQMQELAWISSR